MNYRNAQHILNILSELPNLDNSDKLYNVLKEAVDNLIEQYEERNETAKKIPPPAPQTPDTIWIDLDSENIKT